MPRRKKQLEHRGEPLVEGRRPGPEWQATGRGWQRFYPDGSAAAWTMPHGTSSWQLSIVEKRERSDDDDQAELVEPREIEELVRVSRLDWTPAEAERMDVAIKLGLVRLVKPQGRTPEDIEACRGVDYIELDRQRERAMEELNRRYEYDEWSGRDVAYAGDLSGPEWSDFDRARMPVGPPPGVGR